MQRITCFFLIFRIKITLNVPQKVYLCNLKLVLDIKYLFFNKRIMNKKDYEKPTMNIVKLQQQTHLMAGSGVQSTRNSYGNANSGVTPTELNDAGEWEWN